MTTPGVLPLLGYEVGEFQFGRGTPINVKTIDFGDLSPETNDVANPRADGQRFGRDFYRGRLITITGDIYTSKESRGDSLAAPNLREAFQNAWDPYQLRLTPNAVIPFRMHRAGRIRRVYGRPNRFTTTEGTYSRGWIPFSADFRCVDHLFYDDVEFSEVVPFIPVSIGGLEGDLIGDIFATDPNVGSGGITIQGTKPSWALTKINGPIVNPIVAVTGLWSYKLNVTIQAGQWVLVDPTPWNRYSRRNDGANMSGKFTADSARLSQMRLLPGYNQVQLKGNDPTGTSSVQVFWRDTFGSY